MTNRVLAKNGLKVIISRHRKIIKQQLADVKIYDFASLSDETK